MKRIDKILEKTKSYKLSSKFSIIGNIISYGSVQLRNIVKVRIKGIMKVLV